ncbi:uncharacterized protein LOC123296425 [Chrysoperla carnea]|uniref:uncharacterized protein LOC123296425 n=1 Tax=Chrysoperla carnea TaxID=189513 RepID=UPI001D0691AA|nr:uncharacterized protein LOC123296425 [Chrysoperla carnea]
MAILQSCCCWRTVRKGSYASGIYTTIYFSLTMFMMAKLVHDEHNYLFNEHPSPQSTSILEPNTVSSITMMFSIVNLCCSIIGIVSSLLLLYGLYKDNKIFLIPWIFTVSVHMIIDLVHSIYIFVMGPFKPVNAILWTMDFFHLSLYIYAFLCVVSQYQEYQAGRGTADYERQLRIPHVQYTAPTTGTSLTGMRKGVTYHETRPTPTQSPTALNTSLCTAGGDDSTPNSRRPSRKHVQFPDHNNKIEENNPERQESINNMECEEPFTIDLKIPMLLAPG